MMTDSTTYTASGIGDGFSCVESDGYDPDDRANFVTVAQVAHALRCTSAALRQMIHRGTAPPSIIIGRRRYFDAKQVEEWVSDRQHRRGHRVAATEEHGLLIWPD